MALTRPDNTGCLHFLELLSHDVTDGMVNMVGANAKKGSIVSVNSMLSDAGVAEFSRGESEDLMIAMKITELLALVRGKVGTQVVG